jgi:hypothetical protein
MTNRKSASRGVFEYSQTPTLSSQPSFEPKPKNDDQAYIYPVNKKGPRRNMVRHMSTKTMDLSSKTPRKKPEIDNLKSVYDWKQLDQRLKNLKPKDNIFKENLETHATPRVSSGYATESQNILKNAKMQVCKTFRKLNDVSPFQPRGKENFKRQVNPFIR